MNNFNKTLLPSSSYDVLDVLDAIQLDDVQMNDQTIKHELEKLNQTIQELPKVESDVHALICDLLPDPQQDVSFSLVFFCQQNEDIQIELISDDDAINISQLDDVLAILNHELSFLSGFWVFSWDVYDGCWFNSLTSL